MASEQLEEKAIFNIARQIDSPDARRQYLHQICGADDSLLGRVETLLQAYEEQASFLESPPVAELSPTVDHPITEKPGSQLGPYKLLQQIGEGGMGTVFMAEQSEPVERRVALKIIKPGMDTQQVIARFEAERQALAMMDHPNIAKVLDAGRTDSGRPYFVMELVKGVPITDYCDEQHLTPKERLELFLPVCQAVQHAHQKGIIHRDLKPSNILIAQYDGKPVPKVIDFGVAKAISQKLTEKTMFTQYGQIVGTVEYMSPEQAQFNQLDVDTRSDVYSLGVLLYELLTGETPFDKERLRSAAFDELLRIIRDEEPPKPSLKLSSSHSLPTIAANRHIEPQKLSALIRGELDWIVMKALEKDRNRRYETPSQFAEDVQHYLRDEAVVACPPSATYRFRKFARRNKAVIGTTVAITTSLIIGTSVAVWQAYRATKAEGIAEKRLSLVESQKSEIEKEKQKAVAEAERADKEAAIARAVNDFLNQDLLGMSDAQSQAEADLSPDPNIKLRTVLDRADESIEGRFSDQPLIEAAIRSTIGMAYQSIGAYEEAEQHTQRAVEIGQQQLGREHSETLASMNNLASVYRDQGRYDEAEQLHQQILEIQRQTLGDEHPDTLLSMHNLANVYRNQGRYDAAEQLHQQTLEIRRRMLGDEHSDTLGSMNSLANVYDNRGRYDEAEQLHQQTLEIRRRTLGDEHPHTLLTMNNLACVYRDQGRYDEAEQVQRQTLEIQRRTLGEEHPHTLNSMNNLAAVYRAQGRYDDAERLDQQAFELFRRTLGDEHPATLRSMHSLANVYATQGRYADAEQLHQQTLELRRRTLGDAHRSTVDSMHNLANVYRNQGRYKDAEALYQQTLTIDRRTLGDKHPDTLLTMNNLAIVFHDQGRYEEAEQLHQQTLEIRRRTLGDEHPHTLASMNSLANVYLNQGRYDESEQLYQQTLETQRRTRGDEHPDTLQSMNSLANVYGIQGRYDEAEQLHQQTLEIRRRTLGDEHPHTLHSMHNLAIVYRNQDRHDEAEQLQRQTLEIQRRTLGEGHPETLRSMRNLGTFLERKGDRRAAIKLFKDVVNIDPKDVFAYRELGYAHDNNGDREAAARAYKQALQLNATDQWTWDSLAKVTKANGGHEAVLKTFSELINSGVSGISAYRHRSQAYEKLGQSAEAIADRRHVVELYQQSLAESEAQVQTRESLGTAWRDLGMVLRSCDQLDESEAAFREGLTVWQELVDEFPENQRYRDLLGDLFRQLGHVLNNKERCAEALTCYENALELAPDSHWSHHAMAGFRLYARDLAFRDPEQAAQCATRAVELKPKYRNSHHHLGEARYRLQDWSGAVESWEKAIELGHPADARNAFQLAICYGHLKDQEKGRAWYAKAVILMEKQTNPEDWLVELRKQADEQLETSSPQTVKN